MTFQAITSSYVSQKRVVNTHQRNEYFSQRYDILQDSDLNLYLTVFSRILPQPRKLFGIT
jgi:hypothetical protein